MTATPRTQLGHAGERIARSFLERQGYTFVAANRRYRGGELDLVMHDGTTLVFVEVKTRHGEQMGRAEESLSDAQSARILRAARRFIGEHEQYWESIWRVDLIAVTLSRHGAVERLTHYTDVLVTG